MLIKSSFFLSRWTKPWARTASLVARCPSQAAGGDNMDELGIFSINR